MVWKARSPKRNSIALSLDLSTEQVQIVLRYIEKHRVEVMSP